MQPVDRIPTKVPANGTISRRRLLGAAAAATAAPYIVSASSLGLADTVAPSERITVGLIGCGDHGAGWNLDRMFENADSQVIAVCDVDAARVRGAQNKVDAHYSKQFGKSYKGCDTYADFRELIRRDDIDAVAVCTPDHWHVMPAIMAANAGKDVICEKPLTLFIQEGRILSDVVAKTKRVFQTASENRSIDTYIHVCELVRNGRIGKLTHIHVTLPGGNDPRGANFTQRDAQPVPKGFDYDMWLGQAPVRPYVPARCHGSFRWCLDYSGGRLTDWGAHLIDLAQWGNNTQHSGPVQVSGTGKFPPKDNLFNTAYAFDIDYQYANGVTMKVSSSQPGIRFEGTDGWVGFHGWRAPLAASDPKILEAKIGPDEIHLHRPRIVVPRGGGGGGEHRNFIDCVKSREPCYAPAEIGHRTITVAHIGNIAMQLGRKLKWDPEHESFVDDDQANAMLTRKQREPWAMKNIDSWVKG